MDHVEPSGLILLFGAAAMAGAHLLRGFRGWGWGAVLAAALALAGGAALLRLGTDAAGLSRLTAYDGVVAHAARSVQESEDGRESEALPLVALLGASYSRNAADPARLEAALRAAGRPARVVNLSIEAATLAERQAHLEQFIEISGRVPDLVLIEVSRAFDSDPAFIFGNSKYSARAIEQFGPAAAASTLRTLGEGVCGEGGGKAACLKSAVLAAGHGALNTAGVGLLADARPHALARPQAGFQGVRIPRQHTSAAALATLLEPVSPASSPAPRWARDARERQRQRLAALGAARVAYYFPPSTNPADRAHILAACRGELRGHPCFPPEDGAMLALLNGPVWLDPTHLLEPGAAVYSAWLGWRIAGADLLPAPVPAPAPAQPEIASASSPAPAEEGAQP